MRKNVVITAVIRRVKVWSACMAVCVCSFGLFSCDDYDDTDIRNDIENLEDRVAALEEWQQSVNTNIQSLQGVVAALESRDYITGVTPIKEGDKEVGYTITFQNGEPITIKNGENGSTPVIGVAKDADGTYYWTLDGEALTDEDGNKIYLTGGKGEDGKDAIAPQVRINPTSNEWEISTDGGKTWKSTGVKATGETGAQGPQGKPGDSIFSGVDATTDPNSVTFTLANGTKITVPRVSTLLEITAEKDANTFTVTNSLLSTTGNVVDIRVESENADGTTIVTRAVDTRWTIESSFSGNVLTIVAKPAQAVKYNEKALLKVTVSNADGKVLATGQTTFENKLLSENQKVVSTTDELTNALQDEAITYVALEEDVTLPDNLSQSLIISSDKEIDLNGKTLECKKDGTTILAITEGNVSFSNGTIAFHNTYDGGNKSDIVVGVDKSQDKSDEVVSTATATFSNVKLSGSIYVSYGSTVEISDSEINTELYGICTNANASDEETSPITVSISNTKLTGETPIFINVPATLTMDNCTIIGGWQGVMMRGGTATISNSTISLQESYAEPVEGTDWQKDRQSGKDADWGQGNEVAIAGITMGNNTTSAYQYPTAVTLKNTSVSGYAGYWAVYADATEKCTVTFTYDNACTFSPSLDADKSFKQGKGAGNEYITVIDGSGTSTTY